MPNTLDEILLLVFDTISFLPFGRAQIEKRIPTNGKLLETADLALRESSYNQSDAVLTFTALVKDDSRLRDLLISSSLDHLMIGYRRVSWGLHLKSEYRWLQKRARAALREAGDHLFVAKKLLKMWAATDNRLFQDLCSWEFRRIIRIPSPSESFFDKIIRRYI
jgi:hypothetical protein